MGTAVINPFIERFDGISHDVFGDPNAFDYLTEHNTTAELYARRLTIQVNICNESRDKTESKTNKSKSFDNDIHSRDFITKTAKAVNIAFLKSTTFCSKNQPVASEKGIKNSLQYLPPRTCRKIDEQNGDFDFSWEAASANSYFWILEEINQRLHTFDKWSGSYKYWPKDLAQYGFFYLGSGTSVQCSSCGLRTDIKDWKGNETPLAAHTRLRPNCRLLTTAPNESIPKSDCKENCASPLQDKVETDAKLDSISFPKGVVFKYPNYASAEKRLETFKNWKFADKQNSTRLAKGGYFFTGESDIVRCFCCDLGLAEWDSSDDPWIEHSRHSPKCWFLVNEIGQGFVNKIQYEWRKIYNPKHSAYDDKLSRLATFEGVWRADIEQTAETLADAGFFYEGEEDVVRCHYCDGGLRHWEPGDIPWEEHARWFPFCKFVIKMKGTEYIQQVKDKFETRISKDSPPTQSAQMEDPAVRRLVEMGFGISDATYAVEECLKKEGSKKYSIEDLLQILIDRHETEKERHRLEAQANIKNTIDNREQDPETAIKINKKLKESMLCIRCHQRERSILFSNCGHRVTCDICANDIDYCPYCDVKIKSRLKTYLS